MTVTPPDLLAGVLPVVISGGRPRLKQRPTHRLLPALQGITAPPIWMVRDDHAGEYERDGYEVVTYSRAWAEDYAAAHWISHESFMPGRSFLGAFCGREQACMLAEARGCWAVLQLDDNLAALQCFWRTGAAKRVMTRHGGLRFFADILAAVTLSTNSRMTGAALSAVNPWAEVGRFARPGFPYSLFIERTAPGRHHYVGPTEDDIMQAYQYGSDATQATAALIVPLQYTKEHQQVSGMRQHYSKQDRAVGLQRMAPEMAKLTVRRAHANGLGRPRVFHKMGRGAIRTPLIVADDGLYRAAAQAVSALLPEAKAEYWEDIARKVARRAAKAG